MDQKWIVFPALAATAMAQTPVVSESEKALRTRAEEFFRLQVESKYRQAESLVAEESKDDYYAAHKPPIEGFKVMKVEFLDGGKRAQVTVLSKAKVSIMGAAPQVFEVPSLSSWKLENDRWCWYMDKDLMRKTPFGEVKAGAGTPESGGNPFSGIKGAAPSVEALQGGVKVEPEQLVLVPGGPAQKVTVTNSVPGRVTVKLAVRTTPINGLKQEGESATLNQNEKATFSFQAAPGSKFADTVTLLIEPFNRSAQIQIRTTGR